MDAQDTSDGSYIANAQITVKNTSTGWSKTLYTPPGGVPVYATFGLPGLGGYEISASAIGYLSASTTVSVQNGHTYTVTLGRTGWRVMIQVVDAITGKDLAGVTVTCSSGASETTDLSGICYFVLSTGAYAWTASLNNYQSNATPLISVTQDMDGFSPHPPGPLIKLTPVQTGGVTVTVYDASKGTYAVLGGIAVQLSQAGTVIATGVTNSGGTYSFNGLRAGNYTLTASPSGYIQNSVNATVTAGQESFANLGLTPLNATYAVSIELYTSDAHGNVVPIIGQVVAVYQGSTYVTVTSPTGANGYTSISLSGGTYTLKASVSGYSESDVTISVPGTSTVRIYLTKA